MRICRSIAIAACLTLLPLLTAQAQMESGAVPPWDEQPPQMQNEIVPKRLTLEDLDSFIDVPRPAKKPIAMIPEPPSALEKLYASRIDETIQQYGYGFFGSEGERLDGKDRAATLPAGTVQDDFILSAGDKLDVTIRGQISTRQMVEINAQGMLIIDDFAPITAAGRTLGMVRKELESAAGELHNTQIFVSLAGIRQIGVLVVGHVKKPGRHNLTAFHSVLDALEVSGGVEKTGSLRNIKLIRQGRSEAIDLYDLFLRSGGNVDMLLQDGDHIVVPAIGPTLAVAGAVKRPGIYELHHGEPISRNRALLMGGGLLTPGQHRFMKLESTTGGDESVQEIKNTSKPQFGDGSILMVSKALQERTSSVTLTGHTRQPGTHDLEQNKTLSALIASEKIFGADIYPLIGVIERRDPNQFTKTLIDFPPRMVLSKEFDRKLLNGDKVYLFSSAQIRKIQSDGAKLYKEIAMMDGDEPLPPSIAAFLQERSAFVRGAVRKEGAYPVADGVNLDNVLAVAGGLTLEANRNNIEVTSRFQGEGIQAEGRSGTRRLTVNLREQKASDVVIGPGDTVRVNQKFHRIEDKSVLLLGEVKHPGRYDLVAGDTLLKLIERAGGLSPQAYPAGAVFSRAAERKREESRYRAQAQDLELKLASSLQQIDNDKKPDLAQVDAVTNLVKQLKNARGVGRITVEADPGILYADPEQDILLERGDKIFIPKRPLTVRVGGEVLSPAALQFRKSKTPLEYIRQAGGFTYHSDKDRSFVIYPDGSAEPLQVSAWNHKAIFIPPGSTIIVPRDPKPFSFLDGAERISQVLANLAISGLYIEAIGDDD